MGPYNTQKIKKTLFLIMVCSFLISLLIYIDMALSIDGEELKNYNANQAYAQWIQFKEGKLDRKYRTVWVIRIKNISFFGGNYAKGHLYERKECLVHIVPNIEDKNVLNKFKTLQYCDLISVDCQLLGVTTDDEVILMPISIKKI